MRCIIARFPFELVKSEVQQSMKGIKPEPITGESVVIGRRIFPVKQVGEVITFACRFTAAFRARTRPSRVAPVSMVMLARAMTVPTKRVPVPSVTEEPTCQKTLQAWAPLVRTTELAESVVSVEEGAWKIQTAFGSPCASRVSDPPTSSEEEAW